MRPFLQNFKWCCPDHWAKGILQPIYGKTCVCGFERPPWAIDRLRALPMAAKAVKEGRWEIKEGCTLCEEQRAEGYVLCSKCNSESYFCHPVNFLQFLVDGEWKGDQPFVDEHR